MGGHSEILSFHSFSSHSLESPLRFPSSMAQIGKQNRLNLLKESPQGIYLDGGELGEILLPSILVPNWAKLGDVVDVFLYRDSEDRLIATTRSPKAQVEQFAYLEVLEVNERIGAFLDWGLEKDLLLPFREQKTTVRPGQKIVVYVMIDDHNDRIVASARLNRHWNQTKPDYQAGDPVHLLVAEETPMGYRAIIDNSHTGLLYKSELSEPLEYGQSFQGYIKEVRPDGKIDLRRDAAGYRRVLPLAEDIFDRLVEKGGFLPLNDKTDPDRIRATFGVSKKAFKQALGSLYKQRRIRFDDDGIKLTDTP